MHKEKISISIKENLNLFIPKFYQFSTLSKVIFISHIFIILGFMLKDGPFQVYKSITESIWFFEGFLIMNIIGFASFSIIIEKINKTFKNDLVLLMVFLTAILATWLTFYVYSEFFLYKMENIYYYILIAICYTILFLIYFDWQHKRLSPALSEAKLQALQSRIRPHFLFNSINSIIYVLHKNPNQAENLLLDLADLFRFSMQESTDLVSLKEEIEITNKYLNIEKTRLKTRLEILFNIEADLLTNLYMPRLIIQPLVENAIIHGIEPSIKVGTINLHIYKESEKIAKIILTNTKSEKRKSNLRKTNGIAIENIQQRLSLFFDNKYELSFIDNPEIYTVTLKIPINKK